MSKRGVFVRAYGWYVQWLETDDVIWHGMNLGRQYEVENIEGFLAVRNSTGTYDCLPVMRYDTYEEPKEGVVWLSTLMG